MHPFQSSSDAYLLDIHFVGKSPSCSSANANFTQNQITPDRLHLISASVSPYLLHKRRTGTKSFPKLITTCAPIKMIWFFRFIRAKIAYSVLFQPSLHLALERNRNIRYVFIEWSVHYCFCIFHKIFECNIEYYCSFKRRIEI